MVLKVGRSDGMKKVKLSEVSWFEIFLTWKTGYCLVVWTKNLVEKKRHLILEQNVIAGVSSRGRQSSKIFLMTQKLEKIMEF